MFSIEPTSDEAELVHDCVHACVCVCVCVYSVHISKRGGVTPAERVMGIHTQPCINSETWK